MLHRPARAMSSPGLVLGLGLLSSLGAAGCSSAASGSSGGAAAAEKAGGSVVQEDRVIAGGPKDSLEVRHLVLRGTNEQIGGALAAIAKERYGARPDRGRDPLQLRAQRAFLERNDPILLDRMRGVAAAFGKSIDDDGYDFTTLGFVDLKAGCSIVHLPPSSTASGRSVVSRDYDFTTGALSFGFLPPGMLHPTARPYLVELHPDRGFASLAMVSYDLLSGVIDGINSEGLTVTMAMDNEIFSHGNPEPTRDAAVGLGELQTLRLLLDTCATVEDAKQTLMATKQYYQYVPIHYLVADRNGNAFVWEYSEVHNKEYVMENPGQPLVMTNFTIHKQLEEGKPPSADKARSTCRRYAYLSEKLAAGHLDDQAIRTVHQACDAQSSQAADPSRPPERTFWHAFYYPEERRVRVSYYLRDEPYPGEPRLVKPVRTDYLEFRLDPTESRPGSAASRSGSAANGPGTAASSAAPIAPARSSTPTATSAPAGPAPTEAQSALEAAGAAVKREGKRIVSVTVDKGADLAKVLPLVARLSDLEELGLMGTPLGDDALEVVKTLPALRALNLSGTKVTDAGLARLRGLDGLEYLGLKGTGIGDAGLEHVSSLAGLNNLNLADTRVTDAGLKRLTGLQRLESVNLSNDAVTDAGLAHLGRVPGLAGINLTGTKVTDAGLINLKPLSKLTKLNVTGTAVTEQGVKEAKKFLPFWSTVTR